MRLKNIQLLCQVKTPWQSNYYDSIENKPGYEFRILGDFLHIQKDGKTLMVIHASMVRCAEVVEEVTEPEPVIINTSGSLVPGTVAPSMQLVTMPMPPPKPHVVMSELPKQAPVQPPKRRGRPPKNPV